MKYALKEWNITSEALGQGQVIAIWRKGGIDDIPSISEDASFSVEQKKFVLFPTHHHQILDRIKRSYWNLLDQEKAKTAKDNQAQIKYWAELVDEIEIKSIEQLLAISNYLVNENEDLATSFNNNPNHLGKVLILRVYSLGFPILIPNIDSYAGCKSWVELNIDIPKIRSKAVLSFKDFNQKAKKIKSLIKSLAPKDITVIQSV